MQSRAEKPEAQAEAEQEDDQRKADDAQFPMPAKNRSRVPAHSAELPSFGKVQPSDEQNHGRHNG